MFWYSLNQIRQIITNLGLDVSNFTDYELFTSLCILTIIAILLVILCLEAFKTILVRL